jgi:hypothetical protein
MIKALSPVVQSGAQNMEIAVLIFTTQNAYNYAIYLKLKVMKLDNKRNCVQRLLNVTEIETILKQIEQEQMEVAS